MPARTRALAGFEPTVVVEDDGGSRVREVKYTVDGLGNELLLYTDTVSPDRLSRHRLAALRSRLATALPKPLRTAFARRSQRLSRSLAKRPRRRDVAPGPNAGDAAPAPSTSTRIATRNRGPASLATADGREFAHAARTAEYSHAAEQQVRRSHILQVLRIAGVPTTVVPAGEGAVVVVRSSDLTPACAALALGLDSTWRVVDLEAEPLESRGRRVTSARLTRAARRHDGFRLYRDLPGAAGALVGAQVGVDVQVWTHVQPGDVGPAPAESEAAVVSPRRQHWTSRLSPEQWQQAVQRGSLEVGQDPHVFEVARPIDVVYTWVDGADPQWNTERMAALGLPVAEQAQEAATHAARFRSHDELRYSLRSLEMFAPWVRRVHIVTAGHAPAWLDTDHPRIHVVDHREVFTDPDVLPVFNSHAIESQLHHISGLAEQYLYLNDDVFFGRPVGPDAFFHANGLAKFFMASALIDAQEHQADDVPVMSAAKNNRALIAEVFGRRVTHLFQHTPHPQLRSVLELMEAEHPEMFAQVAASKFRHPDDLSISSSLHHYYAHALGKAVPGRLAYLYLDLAHPRAARRFRALLRERQFDVFCLNDSPGVGEEGSGPLLREFLQQYYPLPSSFELPAAHPGHHAHTASAARYAAEHTDQSGRLTSSP
ncbi:stealth conserved region 3 domain-containing protein [Pseudactinotalea sp. Z1748]|uniref:stealth conserved region 3 domain-containing protein n=1 Tax=Pseudactinotalea sp. Z1748 TaxID=3413027 RepID=UPI003C7D8FC0